MPPYMAQKPSLYGVGSPAYIRPQIDLGGTIDSIANAGNSFIHQAFLRRQAENQMALEGRRVSVEEQRAADERAYREQELGVARMNAETNRARWGWQDPHTDVTRDDSPTPAGPRTGIPMGGVVSNIAPSIHSAFTPAAISGATSPSVTPSPPLTSAPPTSPLTRPPHLLDNPTKLTFTDVPGGYDPRQAASYIRSKDLLDTRDADAAKRQQDRLDAQQRGREYMGTLRAQIETMRENFKKQNGGKEMTGGQKESMLQRAATGLIGQYNGSYDDAADALATTDEGKQLKALGVEPRHLMFSAEQFRQSATKAAAGLERGVAGQSPEEAVGAVAKTRSLLGGRKPAASAPAPAPPNAMPIPNAAPGSVAAPLPNARAGSYAAPIPNAAPAPAARSAKPTITADQAAFLKEKKGWTDERVGQAYTVKP